MVGGCVVCIYAIWCVVCACYGICRWFVVYMVCGLYGVNMCGVYGPRVVCRIYSMYGI